MFNTGFCKENSSLLGRHISAKQSSLAIKVLDNLLKSCVLRLDVEEVYDTKFEGEPAIVNDVVFPAQVMKSNGVDVGVEEQRKIESKEHQSQTLKIVSGYQWKTIEEAYLCTKLVGQDLDSVTYKETRPGTIVEDVVDKDEGNLGGGSCFDSSFGEPSCTYCPDDERSKHASGSQQEEGSTAKFVNHKAHAKRHGEVDDVENTIYFETQLL